MKNVKHPLENPASSRRGKCRPGCSDRVREIIKRARTYRARTRVVYRDVMTALLRHDTTARDGPLCHDTIGSA